VAKSMKHPLSGFVYALADDGRVEVRDPNSERFGIFDATGRWYAGDIREADPQILGWVGRHPQGRAADQGA
jgi:hypothetical protein